jgi:hypothetical protein
MKPLKLLSLLNALFIIAASARAEIYVSPGVYREQLALYKSVILIGADKETTFIDAQGTVGHAVNITAGNVEFSGFAILNADEEEEAGIRVGPAVANVYIHDCSIANSCYYGIYILEDGTNSTTNITVENCLIYNDSDASAVNAEDQVTLIAKYNYWGSYNPFKIQDQTELSVGPVEWKPFKNEALDDYLFDPDTAPNEVWVDDDYDGTSLETLQQTVGAEVNTGDPLSPDFAVGAGLYWEWNIFDTITQAAKTVK